MIWGPISHLIMIGMGDRKRKKRKERGGKKGRKKVYRKEKFNESMNK